LARFRIEKAAVVIACAHRQPLLVGGENRRCHAPEAAPDTLHVAETRERVVYDVTDAEEIKRVLKSYRDFVALCVRKEDETGQPFLIIASY
jgi:hypothetical protein